MTPKSTWASAGLVGLELTLALTALATRPATAAGPDAGRLPSNSGFVQLVFKSGPVVIEPKNSGRRSSLVRCPASGCQSAWPGRLVEWAK